MKGINVMEDFMFKKLDKEEELKFREWARENWKPNTTPDSLWHPVVRDEWKLEDGRYSEYVAAKMAKEL